MAVAPISSIPLPVRGTDYISAFIPPAQTISANDAFTRVIESARSTGAPLPIRGLENAVPRADAVSVLDRALFRDLVGSFERTSQVNSTLRSSSAFLADLGIEGLTGRNGLPQALQGITNDQAALLSASISTLFSTIQALGSDTEDTAPSIGSLLDLTA